MSVYRCRTTNCPFYPYHCPYSGHDSMSYEQENMDFHQMKYGIVSKPYVWETLPISFGPLYWAYTPSRDDWNKHLEFQLEEKYQEEKARRLKEHLVSCIWSWFKFPLQCFGGSSQQQESPTTMAMEPQDIQPLTKPTPPKPAIRDFKNIMVSFHFPKEILRKPECIPNPTEWFVELRHFFVDLPQQLGQLEEFSMMTANAGTTTENDEDVRSLAHWKDYQIPDGAAGESSVTAKDHSHHWRYPNLKCVRRIVFSQRAKDGKWLIGRWMVVAYVFASTPEALQQLDWCQLICSDTMADLHAYSVGPGKLEVTYSAQLTKIYRLDRKRTASSEHACQYGETTGASESEETETEGILDTQMVPTAYHMVPTGSLYGPSHMRYAPVPPGVAIPPELKDRCHLIDRTWPSLMAGGASIPDTTLDKEWDMI